MSTFKEGDDLREQSKWKLERATEAAITAKRWDAAGVASIALAEVLGGDDAVVAAGALMLHQVRRFCVLEVLVLVHGLHVRTYDYGQQVELYVHRS